MRPLQLEDPPSAAFIARHPIRVRYADTDQAGVVHHAFYFHYLEAARLEYLRQRGINYRRLETDDGYGLPIAELRARYWAPARFDDELEVETWVSDCTRARLVFCYRVRRASELLVEATTTVACVRLPSVSVTSIPEKVRVACVSS